MIKFQIKFFRYDEIATQYTCNLIISKEFYLKFYHYQFSLISNAANYNTVILDNSLFIQWRYQRLHIYSYDVDLLKMSRVMLKTRRGF